MLGKAITRKTCPIGYKIITRFPFHKLILLSYFEIH